MLHNLFSTDKADMTAKDYLIKSEQSRQDGDDGYAILYANFAIHLEPESEDGYFARARALIENKRNADAILDFDKIIELNPDNIKAWMGRAKIQPNKVDALYDYITALKIEPENEVVFDALYNLEQNFVRDKKNKSLIDLSSFASKEKQIEILQEFLENPRFRATGPNETRIINTLAKLILEVQVASKKPVFYKACRNNSLFSEQKPEVNNKATDENDHLFFNNAYL